MSLDSFEKKILTASKWSALTEILAKLVSPLSTIVLARLLSPEAFGIMVTATMVVSFAEIFTDAGFQKYLIQCEFPTESKKNDCANVAFWSNFIFSWFLFFLISFFSKKIADIVGCKGYELVIIISCLNIPISSISSIQIALYRRKFDFRTLFLIRIIGIFVPLLVTIPFAYFTRSYWALVLGMLSLNVLNACVLSFFSSWKPKLSYSISLFKEMFSFSFWTMIESVSFWLMGYVDLFIVAHMLNQHYLGIYKTSMSTVGQFVSVIVSATTPVLFAGLSRAQNDKKAFEQLFFKFQKMTSMLLVPLGFCLFWYNDLIVFALLGPQWKEASFFLGLWGMTSSVAILLSHYSGEIYRSQGRPKLSVLSQCLQILCLSVTLYSFKNYSFDSFCTVRALSRFQGIIINMVIIGFFIKMSPKLMFKNVMPSFVAVSIAGVVIWGLNLFFGKNIYFQFFSFFIFGMIYLIVIRFFPAERYYFNFVLNKVLKIKNQK